MSLVSVVCSSVRGIWDADVSCQCCVLQSEVSVTWMSLVSVVCSSVKAIWDMDVSCQCCVFFSLRYVRWTDYTSGEVVPSVVCMSMILKPQRWGRLGPLGLSSHENPLLNKYFYLYTRILKTEPTTIRLLVNLIVLHGVGVLDIIPKKWDNAGCVRKENSTKNKWPY